MSEEGDRRRLADAVRARPAREEDRTPFHLDQPDDVGPPRDKGPPMVNLIAVGRGIARFFRR